MKVKQLSLLLLLLAVLFSACNQQEEPVQFKYNSGIFVVNEGPFGGTGTITWHDPATGATEQDIFGKANDGAVLGEFVQSLAFHDGKGYICIGNGTKIVVVDAATFKYLATIEGLVKPRYILPYGDHFALVTQWGADGNSGTVAKVDLTTNKVLQTSSFIGKGPDKMFRFNDDVVLIPNSGGYSSDSTIAAFRLSTFSVDHYTVTGGKNPGVCALNNSDVFVLCKGIYGFPDPVAPGWLGLADNPAVGQSVPLLSDDLCSSPDQTILYFTGGNTVYQLKNNVLSPLIQQSTYGLACHPVTGQLICTDPKDYNSAGVATIYNPDGTLVESFATGISPGEVVVR